MDSTPVSANEDERLAAVRRYEILDTPPDGAFDRITAIAARLFRVPIAIVSIVDHDRIWFKSHHGIDVAQIGRDPGLCASAILQDAPWILTDARADPRALANPLVAGAFGLRFYAGVPLRTQDGFNLGTLCVIDREPRAISEEEVAQLEDLAAVVMDELELRLSARRAAARSEAENIRRQRKEAQLRRVNQRLQDAVGQKELLLKEVHHRVKNNLQVISSLLMLQSRAVPAEARVCLEESLRRIGSIARLHQQSDRTAGGTSVELLAYLDELAGTVIESYGLRSRIVCCADGDRLRVAMDTGTALGLIATEVVASACKHALPGDHRGWISICLEQFDGRGLLRIRHDGAALPADAAQPDPMGRQLVDGLARQLDGRYRFDAVEGKTFTLDFPVAPGGAHGSACRSGPSIHMEA